MFKSHLYGIEIHIFKLFSVAASVFKSHLYGIEIFYTVMDYNITKV